jgi:CRP-like cAMP-binding protein
MILLILKEANDAENIPEEQKEIYETVFQSHGMKAIDFLHLMSLSERREVKRGEKLITLGGKHNHLHFVQSGRLSVKRANESMPEIHEHQFVGAMSFLTWEGNLAAQNRLKLRKVEQYNQWNSDSNYLFPSSALSSEALFDISYSSIYPSSLDTMKSKPLDAAKSTAETNQDNSSADDGETGLADVTCEVDCVVYSWSFRELRELLVTSPSLGLVFERCLSADLSRKMSTNWSTDARTRWYAELLSHVCESANTPAGAITEREKQWLHRLRQICNVSQSEHEMALARAGWTLQEFEVGHRSHGESPTA